MSAFHPQASVGSRPLADLQPLMDDPLHTGVEEGEVSRLLLIEDFRTRSHVGPCKFVRRCILIALVEQNLPEAKV